MSDSGNQAIRSSVFPEAGHRAPHTGRPPSAPRTGRSEREHGKETAAAAHAALKWAVAAGGRHREPVGDPAGGRPADEQASQQATGSA